MAYRLQDLEPFLKEPEPYKCKTCPYCNGTRDPTVKYPKLPPFEWYASIGNPRFVMAPMVDQSELPFRMMGRKYGTTLCYTPMLNSRVFAMDPEYRKHNYSTCAEDRPLVVQFCGNEADVVLAAARVVEGDCDAVDINLGCPQGIAKKGFYGSYLMERWDVVHTILHTLSVELKVPVIAKMRVFDSEELTLRYARMIRDAGAHLIAVHGRTREMKGQQTGVADLALVARVKQEITDRPVLSNGNIECYDDAVANLKTTGCDGVMAAEGMLWDPRIFANPERPIKTGRRFTADKPTRLDAIAAAREYMEFAKRYPTPFANVKSHVFKIVHHSLEVVPEFRAHMGRIPGTKPMTEMLAKVLDDLEAADRERGPDGPYEKRKRDREGAIATAAAVAAASGDAASPTGSRPAAPACTKDGDADDVGGHPETPVPGDAEQPARPQPEAA
uniref:tRNA-dihydrouridine(16/17) synthase [NAD(P)(+)] n=1 Tax=Neobodo designis TaxID=312471 RepID=A0A7S1QB19_NEODS|mmetsp:Transcript_36773/g.113431  ORF Transcript_36773/g.113431 Transcript_36773/m.113431 type:complete len:444 (+) Transcript_36773:87-1418(+)|eukprot:CAMPEP_0174845684 /NCGR_PEP_ID=MMETSP1114-20130205/11869_1 /TAXON_ID=312471 /ORGANISM="Neobodo designis, Strain CCAP 1951/1" /LENGTH=443 /DNA_ID=CAMNT_0016079939 /DNA_START=87 /DNA_END=1418 /DNA_ORIENTATION=-